MMFDRAAVYIVAHQDDWQLFMDPNISADILDRGCKTIVIHTTAGDAGSDQHYWQAREKAAVNSLLFRMSDGEKAEISKKYVPINGKKVCLVEVANCSLYFLRLPDGGMAGNGFPLYDFQSLSRLRLKLIHEIKSVDALNTFSSAGEVSGLISEIIGRELRINRVEHNPNTILNFPEYDSLLNPNDHSDHLNTALLLRDTAVYDSLKKHAFVHYDIQYSAADLAGTDLFWKVGMFCVYHQTVLNIHGHSTIGETPEYNTWSTKKAKYREIA